jgi:aminoglycoside 6'-N-acetyltransferase
VQVLRGTVVALRPITPDDLDPLAAIFAEPAVAQWWVGYDRDRVEREMILDPDAAKSVYIVDVDGQVAGTIHGHEELDEEYKSASIDIAVGTAWHGRGVATDALRTLARDLIERRGHHHITIDPAATNGRAIACYAKVGFKPVGLLRQHERGADGTFHDALLMDMLADELR